MLYSNIVKNEKLENYGFGILKILRDAIVRTLGPNGANTIVATDPGNTLITKDGYHSVQNAHFNDPIANTFADFYKDISRSLVSQVGDNSTTALDSAYHFYKNLKSSIDKDYLKTLRRKQIVDLVNKIAKEISDGVLKYSNQVSEDMHEIKDIAAVSLNNDTKIGDVVYNIYKQIGLDGYINVDLSNDKNTYHDLVDGFIFGTGRMDESFVNNMSNENELHNSAVLMFANPVNNPNYISYCFDTLALINKSWSEFQTKSAMNKKCERPKYDSLTIIAPTFGRDFIAQMKSLIADCRNKGVNINFNLLQYSLDTEFDRELYYTVSIMCGASIIDSTETDDNRLIDSLLPKDEYNKSEGEPGNATIGDYLGYAKKIISSKSRTVFYDSEENQERIDAEIGRIRAELKDLENSGGYLKRKYELKKRLAVLNKKLVNLYVGGVDDASRKANYELVDDAVNACKSAIKSGYSLGCNIPLVLSINDLIKEYKNKENSYHEIVILEDFKNAFISVYKDIIINTKYGCDYDELTEDESLEVNSIIEKSIETKKVFDLVKNEYTDERIISPAESDMRVVENIASIVSLLLSSNQMIVRNTTEEETDVITD